MIIEVNDEDYGKRSYDLDIQKLYDSGYFNGLVSSGIVKLVKDAGNCLTCKFGDVLISDLGARSCIYCSKDAHCHDAKDSCSKWRYIA